MSSVPPTPPRPAPGHRLEASLARVLLISVLASAALLALGTALNVGRRAGTPVALRTYEAQPPEYASVSGAAGALRGWTPASPLALAQLGVIVLILTPALRVLFAGVGFGMRRDRLYVAVAGIVLAGLALGFFGVWGE